MKRKKYLELFTDGLNDLVSNILAPIEEHLSDDKMQLAGDKLLNIDEDIDIIIKKMDEALDDLQKENIWDEFNEALIKIDVIGKLNERVVLYHEMLPKEHWKLKIYPKNNKSDIKSCIIIDFNIKSKGVSLRTDNCDNKNIIIGYFFEDDGKIKYSSTYSGHIELRLRELLKNNPYIALEKILSIINEYASGSGIIDKYFDVTDYYYDTHNIHSIKFREACAINFIRLFGGEIDYFKPIELVAGSSENKDIIQTIYKSVDLLCVRFHSDIKPTGAYVEFGDSNEIKFKNEEMEEKITFVFDEDKISIFKSVTCVGYIEYIEEVGKYKFIARKSSMDEYDKICLFRYLPDDFKNIIIRLNSIILTSLNYDKDNWYKFIEDQIRVLSYTTEPIEMSFWVHMLKNLTVENYEI